MPPARPMPEPPPVIHATLPWRLPICVLPGTEEVLALFVGHLRAAPVGEHLQRALHRRALGDAIAPAFHLRVLVDVHALPLGRAQPRHDRHVGDGVFAARQPLAFVQSFFEHAVQAVRLVLVAVHRVLDLLRRIAEEVVRLAEHRADVSHLEQDRKSTRLNSSHSQISYAVFCLKKKKKKKKKKKNKKKKKKVRKM